MQQGEDMQSEMTQHHERRHLRARTSVAEVGVCGTLMLVALAAAACTGGVSGGNNPPMGEASSGTPTGGSSTQGVSSGGASSTGTAGTGVQGSTAGTNASTTSPLVEPPNEDAAPMSLDGDPIYTRFVRLTNSQWERSVQDILALPEAPRAATFEVPVAGTTDFANNEQVLVVSNNLRDDYQSAAEAAADEAGVSEATLAQIYSGTDGPGFIAALGRRAYRRPLTAEEQQTYEGLFASAASLSGTDSAFVKGARLVIRAMLQSPHFLYRTELGSDGAQLSSYELASKLSFWLRGTTPSDELLDAAAAGQLDTVDGAVTLAAEMLEEPGAASMMREFHAELLHFDLYGTISKTGVPEYSESMNTELYDASVKFFERIYAQNLGVKDILTSTIGFVGPETASLYGVDVSGAGGLVERDLGAERVGYFSQLPFLILHSFNNVPDPIHRGLQISLNVMCADPGIPGEVPALPPIMEGQTNRERVQGTTMPCGGTCHGTFINPIGFSFENFDGMGRWRDEDNGQPVDATGTYPFSEGTKEFTNAAQLMTLMAGSEQAHACYAKKLSEYALQRDIVVSDVGMLDTLKQKSLSTNSIKEVILELVAHPAFNTRVGGAQ
ncbi:MAG TPA: DUF1592 domain-containing protein [Polyangiaceae bacterium]|nr:DUF1592 domain-containing protein [Polyangiaceae bacterium]